MVAAAFLVALFGFGLGFYGPGIYLVALKARHGWSIEELSSVITAYYVLGASFLFFRVPLRVGRHRQAGRCDRRKKSETRLHGRLHPHRIALGDSFAYRRALTRVGFSKIAL